MSNEYWEKYNNNFEKLIGVVSKYNKNNLFNYVEQSFYPHVRDLSALVIAQMQCENCNGTLRVLDYGSNEMSLVNIVNKINDMGVEYTIYDPCAGSKKKTVTGGLNGGKVVYNEQDLSLECFDLVIFGSSIQYISDVFDLFSRDYILSSDKILFTHTPFSLKDEMKVRQYSGYVGYQTLYSFSDIDEYFSGKNYDLIFKSALDPKFAAVEDEYLTDIVYANLLFSRCAESSL